MPEPTPINDSREHEAARAAAMPVSRRVEIDKKTGWLDVYEREHGEGDWMLIGSHSPVGWLAERDTRIAELELALAKYGTHEPGCLWHEDNDKNACDCGWRAYA